MPVLNTADRLYVGAQAVDKVYAGAELVWPSGFDPASIAGLTAWYDAAQLSLADGADVWVWPDSSGLGHNISARVGQDNPPAFKTNAANGLPVVRFAQSASEFLFGSVPYAVGDLFAVAKFNAAIFPEYNGLFGGYGGELLLLGEGGTDRVYGVGNGPTYYLNGANSTHTRRGPMGVLTVLGLALTTTHPAVTPVVGSERFNAGRYWDGDIAEIITYDHKLADAERQQVDAYLLEKWGVT